MKKDASLSIRLNTPFLLVVSSSFKGNFQNRFTLLPFNMKTTSIRTLSFWLKRPTNRYALIELSYLMRKQIASKTTENFEREKGVWKSRTIIIITNSWKCLRRISNAVYIVILMGKNKIGLGLNSPTIICRLLITLQKWIPVIK